jgi:hypothetical protein
VTCHEAAVIRYQESSREQAGNRDSVNSWDCLYHKIDYITQQSLLQRRLAKANSVQDFQIHKTSLLNVDKP